jgi:hypothetical protein
MTPPDLDQQRAAIAQGLCPECSERIKNWLPPRGAHFIEAAEELKKRGIDPATGHRMACSLNGKLKIGS